MPVAWERGPRRARLFRVRSWPGVMPRDLENAGHPSRAGRPCGRGRRCQLRSQAFPNGQMKLVSVRARVFPRSGFVTA